MSRSTRRCSSSRAAWSSISAGTTWNRTGSPVSRQPPMPPSPISTGHRRLTSVASRRLAGSRWAAATNTGRPLWSTCTVHQSDRRGTTRSARAWSVSWRSSDALSTADASDRKAKRAWARRSASWRRARSRAWAAWAARARRNARSAAGNDWGSAYPTARAPSTVPVSTTRGSTALAAEATVGVALKTGYRRSRSSRDRRYTARPVRMASLAGTSSDTPNRRQCSVTDGS